MPNRKKSTAERFSSSKRLASVLTVKLFAEILLNIFCCLIALVFDVATSTTFEHRLAAVLNDMGNFWPKRVNGMAKCAVVFLCFKSLILIESYLAA